MKQLYIPALLSMLLFWACGQEDLCPTSEQEFTACTIEAVDENSVTNSDLDNLVNIFAPSKSLSRSMSYTISTIANEDGEPCIYVLNFDGGGWVLISATKKYQPILAHNNEGYFDVNDSMAGGFELWKDNAIGIISDIDNQLPQDSINAFQKEWAAISPNAEAPSSIEVDHYTDTPFFCSYFTRDDYDRLRAKMNTKITEMRAQGYTIVTFDDLRYGDLIPGAYGEQGITINDLIRMCEGLTYIFYMENFRFISFAAYKTEYLEERTDPPIQTAWDQENGYNQTFPLENGQLCKAGEEPVAVGQLMLHFRHPTNYKYFSWLDIEGKNPNAIMSDFLKNVGDDMKTKHGAQKSITTISEMENFLRQKYDFAKVEDSYAIDVDPAIIHSKFGDTEHTWTSGGYSKYQRITYNDIYTFTLEDEMTECGNMQQETEYPPTKLVYMNWGMGGKYNGYYSTSPLNWPTGGSSSKVYVYHKFSKK